MNESFVRWICDHSDQHISKRFTLHYAVGCEYFKTTSLSQTQVKRGLDITLVVIPGVLGSLPELFFGLSVG